MAYVPPLPSPSTLRQHLLILPMNRVIVMAANCAGISGSQIFRTSDKPRYIHGLTAICALAVGAWVLAAVLNLYYFNRRRGKAG